VTMCYGIKGWNSFGMLVMIYMFILTISSPYLLVFGHDRVHGTREQIMLYVDLVRRRVGAWAS